MWQGVYFTKHCAKKAEKYFIKRKVVEKEILIVIDIGQKIPSGVQDVYHILFKKPQNSDIKRLYTKKPTEIKKIFTQGELLKFKYADGIIGCERMDLYLLKSEFEKVDSLKSEGYDWPLVVANDESKLKCLAKNKSLTVSLTEIIDDLEKLS